MPPEPKEKKTSGGQCQVGTDQGREEGGREGGSGGQEEAATPLASRSDHQVDRLVKQISSAGGRLGIGAPSGTPGYVPLPSTDRERMGLDLLLDSLVDSRQGPRFGINQEQTDRGLREGRDDIRSPEPAKSRFGNVLRQERINFSWPEVGGHADDRDRVLEPRCLLNLEVDQEPEDIFLNDVRHSGSFIS